MQMSISHDFNAFAERFELSKSTPFLSLGRWSLTDLGTEIGSEQRLTFLIPISPQKKR